MRHSFFAYITHHLYCFADYIHLVATPVQHFQSTFLQVSIVYVPDTSSTDNLCSNLVQGPIATITIKSSGAVYRIHKGLICFYSAYIERAQNIQGADKSTIDEDVSESTMNLFVDWP
jgi:hypothetical protein